MGRYDHQFRIKAVILYVRLHSSVSCFQQFFRSFRRLWHPFHDIFLRNVFIIDKTSQRDCPFRLFPPLPLHSIKKELVFYRCVEDIPCIVFRLCNRRLGIFLFFLFFLFFRSLRLFTSFHAHQPIKQWKEKTVRSTIFYIFLISHLCTPPFRKLTGFLSEWFPPSNLSIILAHIFNIIKTIEDRSHSPAT